MKCGDFPTEEGQPGCGCAMERVRKWAYLMEGERAYVCLGCRQTTIILKSDLKRAA